MINETEPAIKRAIRRVVRGPDGTPRVIYLDAMTGQQLNSLDGYEVVTAGNKNSPTLSDPKDETTAEEIKKSVTKPDYQGSGDVTDTRGNPLSSQGSETPRLGGFMTNPFDRSPGNNYGYVDVPKAMSVASMLPVVGPIASKINTASRVNNTVANNKARETVGLDNLSGMKTAGNLLGLRDASTVANVNIGDEPYSIGFEALNRAGQTTLTPNEARMRSLLTDSPVTEMTPSESREFSSGDRGFVSNITTGIRDTVSGISSSITSLFDNIFGGSPQVNESERGQSSGSSSSSSSVSPTLSSMAASGQGGLF